MSSAVSWNLRVTINEGRLEEFRSLMNEMVTSTKAEPGALCYEWFLSADGGTCQINERYVDSAATMVHLGNFGSKFAERFMTNVTPASIDVYGEPSAEVRGVLDGFGAVYLGTFGGFRR